MLAGGKKDFRVFKDFDETGGAICTCGSYPSGFDVLMAYNSWDFYTCLKEVNAVLNGTSTTTSESNILKFKPRKKPVAVNDQEDRARIVRNLFRAQANSVASTEREAAKLWVYYLSRGLWPTQEQVADIRFAESAPFYNEDGKLVGNYPMMLAVVRNAAGKKVSLHRTFLERGCTGKLEGENAKKLMEAPVSVSGCAIRLGPVSETLGIAEGIETALAVSQATGTVCWAAISAPVLGNFEPPEGVKRVVIWADKDRSGAGEKSAQKLKERLNEKGIPAVIMLPEPPIPEGSKGIDWLDVVANKSQPVPNVSKEVSNG